MQRVGDCGTHEPSSDTTIAPAGGAGVGGAPGAGAGGRSMVRPPWHGPSSMKNGAEVAKMEPLSAEVRRIAYLRYEGRREVGR